MPLTRSLQLPPKGRPHWLPNRALNFELGYLSWGFRWYGDAPIEPSLHEGWHYFIVVEGTPTLLVQGKAIKARPGLVCISHPDCPVGHQDELETRCRILTWIWRTPPMHSALTAVEGGFLRLVLDRNQLTRVQTLHAGCHKSVALANERGMLELRSLRIQLDLCLLEALEHRGAADSEFRFNLAVEYLRNHLNEFEPVKRLCEYLQISEASLKRLFHQHAAKSPRAFSLGWRMEWAHTRLQNGKTSVKEVAYALGYRHPNDFSRAFKRHYHFEASSLLVKNAKPRTDR